MIKDELKKAEPIAYRSLANALKNNRVAHSYLFSGEYNPLKIETAYLLAMSIIEGKNDFACEECNTCQRIRKNQYFDVIFVDGYASSIKKDDIENIFDEFTRTSLESAGRKVYILANVNNSSVKVLNMILKFMEEPESSDTYGILISDRKEDLLPTVVSRCQEIPFLTRDFSFLQEKYEEKGFDPIDAYLLANILHEYDDDFDLNDRYYLTAKDYVYKLIDNLDQPRYLPVLFYREFYPSFKDRDDFRKCADYYMAIMMQLLEDTLTDKASDDSEYEHYRQLLGKHDPARLMSVFAKAKEKIGLNAERKLLFDAICCEIISYN